MIELYKRNSLRSYAVNAENPTGRKGGGAAASSVLGPSRKGSPCLRNLKPGSVTVLADIEGSGCITHIWVTVDDRTSDAERFVLRDLVLRMYWDGEELPAVETPLGDFFLNGFGETYFVDSAYIVSAPQRGLNCYIPMPFSKRAVITLENQHAEAIPAFFYQVDYVLGDENPDIMTFHASWRRENPTVPGEDYTVIDGIKGEGTYIGTALYLSTLSRYWYGEGEMKFYIDGDDRYPTICSTGLEDYFGGSWSFARQVDGRTVEETYSTLYLGYPFYSNRDSSLHNKYHMDDCPPMRAFYRWHIKDPIFFKESLRVTLQQIGVSHRGLFERSDDVSSVAYWYQAGPTASYKPLPPREDREPR